MSENENGRSPEEQETPDTDTNSDDKKSLPKDKDQDTPAEADDSGESGEGEDEEYQGEMTLMQHLDELRRRLMRCFIAVGVGFLACYGFAKELFGVLMDPLVQALPEGNHLQATALPETFFTYIKVSLVAGAFLVSPYIFHQFWRFVTPGLYPEERKYLVPIAFFSALFFTGGALFGYFVVFPFAFNFFAGFSNNVIILTPKISEYFSFSLKLLFAFGLIFELPLVIFFLARLGIVHSGMLRKFRKYAILCAFIVSAILTPPDLISQLLMSGPLIILYELSIWVAHFFGKKRPVKSEDALPEEES